MRSFLLSLALLFSLSVNAQNYDCIISHTMARPEGELNSTWQVFIKDNSGIIKLDGVIHDKNKGNIFISRQIFFNVDKFSEQGYHFTSHRIKNNPADNISNDELAQYYPDFFVHEERMMMFTLIPEGNNIIMSWATAPMFFCYSIP
jgi:hypothetical protein